jgi:hypothetical protein
MQYYFFELYEESQDLCTIITPFLKYKYLRLTMGLKCSPDIAQAIMENVLSGIKDVDIYIDDVGAFINDWNHHINLLSTILHHLCKNGFTINLLKCEWTVKEMCLAWLLAYSLWFRALEKENQHRPSYGSSLQCHRTVHVHWLRELVS